MLTRRPFASTEALFKAAAGVWTQLERADMLEAFAHHPRSARTSRRCASVSRRPRRGRGGAGRRRRRRRGDARRAARRQLALRERFGYIFIVCATGKSAAEMLALLRARLANDAGHRAARSPPREQAKITAPAPGEAGTMSRHHHPRARHRARPAGARAARPPRRARRRWARPHRRRARHRRPTGRVRDFVRARHARRAAPTA